MLFARSPTSTERGDRILSCMLAIPPRQNSSSQRCRCSSSSARYGTAQATARFITAIDVHRQGPLPGGRKALKDDNDSLRSGRRLNTVRNFVAIPDRDFASWGPFIVAARFRCASTAATHFLLTANRVEYFGRYHHHVMTFLNKPMLYRHFRSKFETSLPDCYLDWKPADDAALSTWRVDRGQMVSPS